MKPSALALALGLALLATNATGMPHELRRRLHPTSVFQRSLPGTRETKQAMRLSQLAYNGAWTSKRGTMEEARDEYYKHAPDSEVIYITKPGHSTSRGTSFMIVRSPTLRTVTVAFTGSVSPVDMSRKGLDKFNRQGLQNWFKTNLLTWHTPLEKGNFIRNLPFTGVGASGVGMHYGFKMTYDSRLGRHVGLEKTSNTNEGFVDEKWGRYVEDHDSKYDLETKITKLLKKHMTKRDELIVTGHSLGGALATIFGTKYALGHAERDVRVVTFGAPRVGNHAFRELVEYLPNLAVARVVDDDDIVARMPVFGYYHVGHTIEVGQSDPEYFPWNVDGHPGWDALTMLPRLNKGIADHAMHNYIKETKKSAKGDWLRSIDSVASEIDEKATRKTRETIRNIGKVADFRVIKKLKPRSPVGFLLGLLEGLIVGFVVGLIVGRLKLPMLRFLDRKNKHKNYFHS